MRKCILVIFHWIHLCAEIVFKIHNMFCAKKMTPQYDHLQSRKYSWTDLELGMWSLLQTAQ